MLKPLLILALLSPSTGCLREVEPTPPPIEDALFCDTVTDPAWFTQEEIDDRTAAGWTRNLAWQYAINLSWDRECEEPGP